MVSTCPHPIKATNQLTNLLMMLSLLSLFTLLLSASVFAQDGGAYDTPLRLSSEYKDSFIDYDFTGYDKPYSEENNLPFRNRHIRDAILNEASPEEISALAYFLCADAPEEPRVSVGDVFLKLEDDPRIFAHITVSYSDYPKYGDADIIRAMAIGRELASRGKKVLFKLDDHRQIPPEHIQSVLRPLLQIGQLDLNLELMRSARVGRFDLVEFFLDNGANVQISELGQLGGSSTLQLCLNYPNQCNRRIKEKLIKSGAKELGLTGGRKGKSLFDF